MLAESLQDPVLRRWHWRRLRRKAAVNPNPPPARPGDAAVEGTAIYLNALTRGNETEAAQGLRMLVAAADQAIAPSGITREGSSLRQKQLAELYVGAWLAARRGGRPEQWRLAAIARSLIAALEAITLPGGLPEIGGDPRAADSQAIPEEDHSAAQELRRQARLDDLEALRADGWLRLDAGPWSGLWHCPTDGWPAFDGLAHQDATACEIHWRGEPLFVDPGSPPADGPELEQLYRSHAVHNGISLDGRDPYPLDRPLYDAAFRRDIAGPEPILRSTADGVRVVTDGYARFGGHRQIERHWRFVDNVLRIDDLILGTGRPLIERRLITPWQVTKDGNDVILGDRLRIVGDHPATLHPARRWVAGEEQPLTLILFAGRANLPWRGGITVQPV